MPRIGYLIFVCSIYVVFMVLAVVFCTVGYFNRKLESAI